MYLFQNDAEKSFKTIKDSYNCFKALFLFLKNILRDFHL